MRILHINWGLTPGGIETMLVDIINEQSKTEDVALVIVNDIIDDSLLKKIDSKVKIYLAKRSRGSKNPWFILKINLFIRRFKPNIIHSHQHDLVRLCFYHCPKVRTIHNTRNKSNEYTKLNALFAISETVREYTKKQGFDAITVLNGIVSKKITPKKVDYSVHENRPLKIVQVSRLDIKQKGQDLLLRALHICNKIKPHAYVLHLIGEGEDFCYLKDLAKNLDISALVFFEGMRDRDWIYNNLHTFDLFVQPSRYEGFGLTVAEACAAKLPVLVSNIEGPLEIINGGKLGMTFIAGDEKSLAEKLLSFLDGNYPYQKIEEAYQRTIELYDVAITAKKYLEEYKKIY